MKKLFFLTALGFMVVLALLHYYFVIDVNTVRSIIPGYEPFAVLVFFLLLILATFTEAIPLFLLFIVGGVLFGTLLGALVSLAGLLVGVLSIYYLALKENMFKSEDISDVQKSMKKDYVWTLFVTRLIPVVPNNIVSIAAARHRIPVGEFILIIVIGNLPYVFLGAALGDALVKPTNIALVLLAIISSVLLSIHIFRRHFKKIIR